MQPEPRDRPAANDRAISKASMPIKTEPIVTRAEVEALLGTLHPDEPAPWWYTHPSNEAQFAATLLAHRPAVSPVYDADDVLVAYRGIRLRRRSAA
jgi:hypothetical protein